MKNPANEASEPGPPRLLLGVGLLFWGGLTGHAFVALLAAFVCEACHWTRVRWDFDDNTFYRAWQASVLLLLVTGLLVWMDASILTALPRTLVWLPVVLLPLQFVQSYGMQHTMPLATFSLFVRKRREHARRHGLPFRDIRVAFGWVYLACLIIAAGVDRRAPSTPFFIGVVILVGWAFHRRLAPRRGGTSIGAAAAALAMLGVAAGGGVGGQLFFQYLFDRFVTGGYPDSRLDFAEHTRTSIGDFGEIKQSPNILWRLKRVDGPFPRLLRLASYNRYLNTNWRAHEPPGPAGPGDAGEEGPGRPASEDFIEPDVGNELRPGEFFRVTARDGPLRDQFVPADEASAPGLPRFLLRGAFARKGLLPIPGNTTSLIVPNQEIEINSYGALRVDPKHPVANALILTDAGATTGMPPIEDPFSHRHTRPDLAVSTNEAEAVRRVAGELGLHEGDLTTKINKLRTHFGLHFSYTRYNQVQPTYDDGKGPSLVTRFLEETRRGHCEYFATATALLLREAGVPTRYATGFAVVETRDNGREAIIRGTHSHAWCLAWDEARGTWIDVDLTPPDWTGRETPRVPFWQPALDRWQILRDDLLVWRSEPGNFALALTVLFLPIALGGAFIARRLWRSRRRIDPVAARRKVLPQQAASPLHALERPAAGFLGERPPGQPLGAWILGLNPFLREKEALDEAVLLHRLLRFDPAADPESLRAELAELVERLRRDLDSRPALAGARPSYP